MSNAAKNSDILASLSVLHNYFDIGQRNYFSDLYPAEILDPFSKIVLSV